MDYPFNPTDYCHPYFSYSYFNPTPYGVTVAANISPSVASDLVASACEQNTHGKKRRTAPDESSPDSFVGVYRDAPLMNSKMRKVDPFAPECSIPLPFQMGDEYGYYGPSSIWKRNERERHRVRCVNDGYEKLRHHLPLHDTEKRLSKVETLRLAIRYIQHLEKLLADSDHMEHCDCNLNPKTPNGENDDDSDSSDYSKDDKY